MTTEPEHVQVAVPDSVTVQILRRQLAEERARFAILEDKHLELVGVVSTLLAERRDRVSPPIGSPTGVTQVVPPDPGASGQV